MIPNSINIAHSSNKSSLWQLYSSMYANFSSSSVCLWLLLFLCWQSDCQIEVKRWRWRERTWRSLLVLKIQRDAQVMHTFCWICKWDRGKGMVKSMQAMHLSLLAHHCLICLVQCSSSHVYRTSIILAEMNNISLWNANLGWTGCMIFRNVLRVLLLVIT